MSCKRKLHCRATIGPWVQRTEYMRNVYVAITVRVRVIWLFVQRLIMRSTTAKALR